MEAGVITRVRIAAIPRKGQVGGQVALLLVLTGIGPVLRLN
jgi:hypothetical protein